VRVSLPVLAEGGMPVASAEAGELP
jgi:hypothetical protein